MIFLVNWLVLRLELKKQLTNSIHGDVIIENQEKYKIKVNETEKDTLYSLHPLFWRQIINYKKDFPTVFIIMDNMKIGVFLDRENIIICNDKYYRLSNTEYKKIKDLIKRLEKTNEKKTLIKKILCVISVATITAMNTFTALAADSYAYSIGTDYGGLFGVDTSNDAENASTVFALAGYKSYYSIKPTVSYMRGENPAGGRRIGSDILFYSGHGNNQCVSFNI